jgi:hypothetical protein
MRTIFDHLVRALDLIKEIVLAHEEQQDVQDERLAKLEERVERLEDLLRRIRSNER